MEVMTYEWKDTLVSDHKPVLGYFNIKLYRHVTNLYEDYSEKVNQAPIEHIWVNDFQRIDDAMSWGTWVFYSGQLEETKDPI